MDPNTYGMQIEGILLGINEKSIWKDILFSMFGGVGDARCRDFSFKNLFQFFFDVEITTHFNNFVDN